MTVLERRLRAEWDLLQGLAALNPGRLSNLRADDSRFHLILHRPAAAPVEGAAQEMIVDHVIRLQFPVHFPAVPLELYVQRPVQHPNIHPLTGFVCLWDRHRVSNTVEHALHKLVAMLCGRLFNQHPVHVMQPETLAPFLQRRAATNEPLPCEALIGLSHDTFAAERVPDAYTASALRRRNRLS